MKPFLNDKWIRYAKWIFATCFFLLFFLYFVSFNKFHLVYLEQLQLFQYSSDYFLQFTTRPGQLIFYLGEFLSQFFVSPVVAAAILTLLGCLIYFLFNSFLKKLGIYGFIWSLIPLLLLAAIQSDFQYKPSLTVGIVLALAASNVYIRINKAVFRLFAGVILWIAVYYLSCGFALLLTLHILLSEWFYFKQKTGIVNGLVLLLVSIILPYVAWRFVYYINLRDAWFFPFPFWGVTKIMAFGALVVYFPFVILALSLLKSFPRIHRFIVSWNYLTVFLGLVIISVSSILVKKHSYDRKTEILLGMDYYVQKQDWYHVLELSNEYPGRNQLILYYTNLALYKTGQMGDRMFDYPQLGIGGLRLEWKRNEVAPFFGGEIFYHLNYINEAFRWAFESMEVKGLNPRSLKRLALTSLINRQYKLASKYLGYLNKTLFYKSWAAKYNGYVDDTTRIDKDEELSEKRKFLVRTDFISDQLDYSLGLKELLQEHPDNRMAFEYQTAVFLLNKDIAGFASQINRLKELGYQSIPVHYEEALLFCNAYFKRNLVPEGLAIRPETLQRMNAYIEQLSQYGGNREQAKTGLYNQFGNTYWYYLHFIEIPRNKP